MISLPWYLLAIGLVLVVVGFVLVGLSGGSGSRSPRIHARMRDADIVKEMRSQQRLSPANLVILLGMMLVLVSIVWRLALYVL